MLWAGRHSGLTNVIGRGAVISSRAMGQSNQKAPSGGQPITGRVDYSRRGGTHRSMESTLV